MRRRDFLTWMGVGLAGSTVTCRRDPSRSSNATTGLSDLGAESAFTPDVELALTAAPSAVQILPGTLTRVWTYSGSVVKGPPGTLQNLPGSYPWSDHSAPDRAEGSYPLHEPAARAHDRALARAARS